LALQLPAGGGVPQAGDANGGVDGEAGEGDAGRLEPELEQAVGEVAELVQVVEEV
jgi:hypothetical protein